jgi:hypothetical protein
VPTEGGSDAQATFDASTDVVNKPGLDANLDTDAGVTSDASAETGGDAGKETGPTTGDASDAGVDVVDAAEAGPVGCNGVLACERRVFVTSSVFQGNLGGVSGADAKCQALADASGNPKVVGRKFLAWVSVPGNAVTDRFPHGTAAYRLVDDSVVATSWNNLINTSQVQTMIELDEQAGSVKQSAWTGTTAAGFSTTPTCEDWTSTSNAFSGTRGITSTLSSSWTQYSFTLKCDQAVHLYCFEY